MKSKSKASAKSKGGRGGAKTARGGTAAAKPKDDLRRQERRASQRAVPASNGEAGQLAAAASAAKDFARKVAGEDKIRYVQAFQAAYNIAAGAIGEEGEERSAVPKVLRGVVPLASQTFYTDTDFVANAAQMIEDTNRIVGGVATNEFPDCVAVGSLSGWCCTGTLVARNVVVTAGHCRGGCSSRVFIGTNVALPGEIINVASAVRHPQYGQGGKHNDLTVLILERDVTSVSPRKIATSAMVNNVTSVRVVGYGNTDPESTTGYGIRRMVDVPVASASCSTAQAQAKYGCDIGLELVAGKPLLNKDSCNGDSGGPIYVKSGSYWYVAGATSRATKNSTRPCGDGGIYVRLDKYAAWIRSVPGGHWS
ncbi:MAG TPA: trypsin-like serine protease [Pyrinomonadaceae bacterium]|nr:trypsin-like serine protease [Pyrinomonadaceae bacterium]